MADNASFAGTTLFCLINLPVEFDATKRALAWLSNTVITVGTEHHHAIDALKWAALASLATVLYYIMIFMGRRS